MRALLLSIMTLGVLAGVCIPASAWKQDDFIITFWCPPPATDENLVRAASEGYNLTSAPVDGLDVAARHKLRVWLQDGLLVPSSLDDPAQRAKLEALIRKVKTHPALEGYYITDEPGSGAFPGLGRLSEFIKKLDPRHLVYINLFPTYANEQQLGVSADEAERQKVGIPLNFAGVGDYKKTILAYKEHLRQYVEIVKPELISYDHYHFLKNGVDGAQYFLNLGLIRESAQSAGVPFLNIIQASTIEPSWRLVNKNELQWLVNTTLAYGGKGISYFLYWGPVAYGGLYQDGKQTPLALDVADINSGLALIGREMMKLKSTAVYHTDPIPVGGTAIPSDSPIRIIGGGQYVLGLFSRSGLQDTFMVVNRDYKHESTARIVISDGVTRLKEFNKQTGRWKDCSSLVDEGSITIDISPGDGRLFRIFQVK